MAMLRRKEQTEAARQVGVTDLVFLGHGDGRVEPTLELRADISRVIREFVPAVVITQSPERNLDRIYASHPDHLAAGEAALCAVYPDARNPFAFPELLEEGLEPWAVDEVWVMGGGTGNASDRRHRPRRPQDRRVDVPRQPAPRSGAHRNDGSRVDGQHGQAVRPARGPPPRRSASSTPAELPFA